MRKSVPVALVCLFLALPVFGGIHYRSRVFQEGAQASEAAMMVTESWVDGDNAKIAFTESGNPMMGAGTYLLSNDGGRTLYLVNPEKKTYSEWDLEAMVGFASDIIEGMGPMLNMEIENPKVETLLEEAGGTMVGLPTAHYRYRTSYDMKMKVIGIKRMEHVEQVQDIWSTNAVDDPGFGVWLRRDPPDFGNEGFGQLLRAEMEKIKGVPLKTITEQVSVNKKGKEQVTRTIMEVTELTQKSIEPSVFVLPPDYENVPMLPTMQGGEQTEAAEQEEEENPLSMKSLFGRKKKKDKDDG